MTFFTTRRTPADGEKQKSRMRMEAYAARRREIWAEERRAREEKWLKKEEGELDDSSTGV